MKKMKLTLLCTLLLFVSKIEAQTFQWSNTIVGLYFNGGYTEIMHSAVDKNGNLYTVGGFLNQQAFNGTVLAGSLYKNSGFVMKTSRDGNLIWVKQLSETVQNTSDCYVNNIALDTIGNLYITGKITGTIDVDGNAGVQTLTSNGLEDIFIVKWDTAGNYIWKNSIGSVGVDIAEAIDVTKNGQEIFITGSYENTVDFDPGAGVSPLSSASAKDAFVLSLNNLGDFVWVKGIAGSNNQIGLGIDIDNNNNLYVTGSFMGTTAFATLGAINITSNGEADGFIAKYDHAGGNPLWVKRIGGADNDEIKCVKVDKISNNIYVGGTFRVTVDFDPGAGIDEATSIGTALGGFNNTDAFIVKLDQNGNYIWKNIHANDELLALKNIDVDIEGNIYAVGTFTGTVTTSHGVTNLFAAYQGWVSKINSLGATISAFGVGQQQYQDEATAISVSDFLEVNLGGNYNRLAPAGYNFLIDLAGGSITTDKGYLSAISQYGQKRPTIISYTPYPDWNYANIVSNVNPEGANTNVQVHYGTTLAFGNSSLLNNIGNGQAGVNTYSNIQPLTGNTKYYYQIVATSIHGTTTIIDSFTTPIGPVPIINVLDPNIFGPIVINITNSTADITNVEVNANGYLTNVEIEYGHTQAYGSVQTASPATVTGNSLTQIGANLTALTPGVYHFRVKATSVVGTTYSADYTFIIAAPLPVLWYSFAADFINNQTELKWITSSEFNASHFEIEKSSDTKSWNIIGNVKAVGNSTMQQTYHFKDQNVEFGNTYYRLKQIDIDGKYSYSNIEKISKNNDKNILIYPNPSSENIHIVLQELNVNANIKIVSVSGQILINEAIVEKNFQKNISQFPQGNYLIQIQNGQENHTIKFVKK